MNRLCVNRGDGYCLVHERPHALGLWRWAADPGPIGQKYRRKWDLEVAGLWPSQPASPAKPIKTLTDQALRKCPHNGGRVAVRDVQT